MTKDDIIRMAQEAGWSGIYSQWVSPIEREHLTVPVTMEQIERFAALVAAAEREDILEMCKEGLWDGEGIKFHLAKRGRL